MGSVDGHRSPRPAIPGQDLEHAQPDALPAPAVEAVVDGRVGAVFGWAVTPTRAAPEHVRDARDPPRSSTRCTPLRPRGSRGPIRAHAPSLSQVNCRFIKTSVPPEILNQQIQPTPTLLSTAPRRTAMRSLVGRASPCSSKTVASSWTTTSSSARSAPWR